MINKLNNKQKQGKGERERERERKKDKLGLTESRIKFFNNHQSGQKPDNPNLT